MKLILTVILSVLIMSARGQNSPAKETTVFYNSFSWSPYGKSLCYSVVVLPAGVFNGRHWEIGSINIKTKAITRITNNNDDDDWAAYATDGKKLVFESQRDGNPQIYVMDVDGKNPKRLSNNTFAERHPAWSPDGKEIMFLSNRDGNPEIYKMNTDGSGQVRLTTSPFSEFNPQWSPNGKKILYYYEKGDHKDQLYIADKDGSNVIKISSDSTHNYYPSWSPDGENVIYAMNGDLWKMNLKNPDEKKELMAGISYAKYSPDGRKIAFKKGNWPSSEIWICGSDGSNAAQLTDPQKMKRIFIVDAKCAPGSLIAAVAAGRTLKQN